MQPQHPFAQFVSILARGKTKTRALTLAEAKEAMAMICCGETEPEQVGAFLMLLRLREETAEEIAGFTLGARSEISLPDKLLKVDVDWSSYAGKRRQLPWFILSALALAGTGMRVFMHGCEGHTPGRLYTQDVLKSMGVPISSDLAKAQEDLRDYNFAYCPLKSFAPVLDDLIHLRPILGLRSPVLSFARMLNPFGAPMLTQGIFHRGFMDVHAGAAMLLEQPAMSVFRGEGGEFERRPNKPTPIWTTRGSCAPEKITWPALIEPSHHSADPEMNPAELLRVWTGASDNAYGLAAISGTMAVVLKSLGRASSIETAEVMALDIWESRTKTRLIHPA